MKTLTNSTSCNGLQCKTCLSRVIIHDQQTGDLICRTSGFVLSEREPVPETGLCKNSEGKFKATSKIVSPLTPFAGYTTFNPKEGTQQKQSMASENLLRAAKQNTISWEHGRLLKAKREIERIAHHLGIPEHIMISTGITFQKLAARNYLRGRKINLIITALFAELFQFYPISWNINDLLEIADIGNRNEFQTCRRNLNLFLRQNGLIPPELIQNQNENRIFIHIQNQINHYALILGLPIELIPKYLRLIQCNSIHFHANTARGIAAAVLYLIAFRAGKHLCQSKIAELLGVNEITLRNNLRIIQKLLQRIQTHRENQK